MKLYLTTLFLSVAAVSAGRRRRRRGLSKDEQFHRKMQSFSEDPLEDCLDCMEDLDDARDCLRDCADDSIQYNTTSGDQTTESQLALCLDESASTEGNDDSLESEEGIGSAVSSLDGLVECCDFDSDCERDLEDAQDCLEFCLDTCIADEAEEYLDCIRDEAESSSCDLDDCITDFLSDDLADDLDESLESSNDLFSLEAIERRIVLIDENQLEDCNLLGDFVDSVCDIATDCCDRCEEEMGEFIDCLVNDIVIPFVSIELNKTIPTCPIDTEECELESLDSGRKERRQRRAERAPATPEEEALIQRALSLPSKTQQQNKRSERKEAMIAEFKRTVTSGRRLNGEAYNNTAAIKSCEDKMRMNVVAANMTHAMNMYTECVSMAAIETLAANSKTSAAPVSTPFAALVAAVAGVAVMFF